MLSIFKKNNIENLTGNQTLILSGTVLAMVISLKILLSPLESFFSHTLMIGIGQSIWVIYTVYLVATVKEIYVKDVINQTMITMVGFFIYEFSYANHIHSLFYGWFSVAVPVFLIGMLEIVLRKLKLRDAIKVNIELITGYLVYIYANIYLEITTIILMGDLHEIEHISEARNVLPKLGILFSLIVICISIIINGRNKHANKISECR